MNYKSRNHFPYRCFDESGLVVDARVTQLIALGLFIVATLFTTTSIAPAIFGGVPH